MERAVTACRTTGQRQICDYDRGIMRQMVRTAANDRLTRCGEGCKHCEGIDLTRGGVRCKRRWLRNAPQQGGDLLQCRALRQGQRILPAIIELALMHGRKAGGNCGLAPIHRARRNRGRLATTSLADRNFANVIGIIKTSTAIDRIAIHSDPAAARVGIECLRLDAQSGERCIPVNPDSHIDYMYQD